MARASTNGEIMYKAPRSDTAPQTPRAKRDSQVERSAAWMRDHLKAAMTGIALVGITAGAAATYYTGLGAKADAELVTGLSQRLRAVEVRQAVHAERYNTILDRLESISATLEGVE